MSSTHAPGDLPHLSAQSTAPYVPGRELSGARALRETGIRGVGASSELTAVSEPSRAWRIVRMALGVLGILALLEAVVIMAFALVLAGSVASRLHDATSPTPVVTGCPFGPDACGG